jgi:GNAT superfamily N-acetyltransferase
MLRTISSGHSVATDTKPYPSDNNITDQIRDDIAGFSLKLREYEAYLEDYRSVQHILDNIDVMGGVNYKRMTWRVCQTAEEFEAVANDLLTSRPLWHQFIIDVVQHHTKQRDDSIRWRAVVHNEEVVENGVTVVKERCVAALVHSKPNLPYLACCEIQAADFAGQSYSAELRDCGEELPGVLGMEIYAATFLCSGWMSSCRTNPIFRDRTIEVEPKGVFEIREMSQEYEGKYRASAYSPFGGHRRSATAEDIPLVAQWLEEYHDETFPPHRPRANFTQKAKSLCLSGNGQLWIGEDGTPRGLAAYNRTIAGFRSIGPVYTPKDSRGKGVASYLVGDMTRAQLAERDCRGLTLLTNLLNPTSNGVYQRIGYVQIGTMLRLTIVTPATVEEEETAAR